MPSPLERMAAEVANAPRPSMRREPPRRPAPQQPQAFTPLPSGGVGSSFGPGGLNPGPRMAGAAPPPPAFAGDYDDDYGGSVSGPPVYNAEPDEDEEMSITEMALMDHAARTGFDPEDLVIRYDASSAEEMRDAAMRQFYERQQSRRAGPTTNNPFAPAGMRGGPSNAAPLRRNEDPRAAGGALAARLANRRRREEEEAGRTQAAAAAAPAAPEPTRAAAPTPTRAAAQPAPSTPEPATDEGALARLMARRRRALGIDDTQEAAPDQQPEVDEAPAATGRRHAEARAESSPGLRSVPLEPELEEGAPSLEDMAAATPTRRSPRATKKAAAPAKKTAAKAAPAAKKTAAAPKKTAKAAPAAKATKATKPTATKATKAAATKATKAPKATAAKATKAAKGGASLAKAPATKKAGKTKTVFCIECGEKNPAIAKFCFNCGTRLAAPEN